MTRKDEINHAAVRAAIDDCFSDVENAPSLLDGVMRKARGEEKMKKKLSFGLVFAIVLTLAAVTALAAGFLGWGDGAKYLEKEKKHGYFDTWTGEERAELVKSLIEYGAIAENSDTKRLLTGDMDDTDRAILAQDVMTKWLEAPVDHVAFRPIMEKIWGEFSSWSLEQKAWLTDTMIAAGIQQPDFEKYVLPSDDVLSQKNAEKLARTYVEWFMGAQPGEFDRSGMVSEYVVLPARREINGQAVYTAEGAPPVWLVQVPLGEASNCTVEIDPVSGAVDLQGIIGSIQYKRFGVDWRVDDGAFAVSNFLSQHHFASFFDWSLEEKAEWSDAVRALILRREESEPDYYDIATRAMTRRKYGLPDERAIGENDALTAAQQALLTAYGLTKDEWARYDVIYTYYDVTDTAPEWRFHFSMNGRQATDRYDDLYELTNYIVEVSAQTGEIKRTDQYRLRDVTGYDAIMRMI